MHKDILAVLDVISTGNNIQIFNNFPEGGAKIQGVFNSSGIFALTQFPEYDDDCVMNLTMGIGRLNSDWKATKSYISINVKRGNERLKPVAAGYSTVEVTEDRFGREVHRQVSYSFKRLEDQNGNE